jgi:hypothetical protein
MIKRIVFFTFFSFIVTYLTLLIPREVTVTRADILGCEKSCQIVAAGFPIPYLIDGYTSPIGSISMNPLIIIFTKTDVFSIKSFFINFIFWYITLKILTSITIRKARRIHEISKN